ncbi:MAG: ATP-dependent RecD-like DNA helicase [Candidatus Excrementavichristensenella sp.]|jgi:exodeoxyribonuclease V alpha subunit
MIRLEGTLEEIIFRNEENGYTVFALEHGREHTVCVGNTHPWPQGERLLVEGEWSEHRDYGRQLKISSCQSVLPTGLRAIEKYLGSGMIRGVGAATARLIVNAFGKDTLEVLEEEPERLTEIPGIGAKRAAMIVESYRERRQSRLDFIFLQGCGLSPAMASRVIKAFGTNTQAEIRKDPYVLVKRVEGIGFRTADAIAGSLGIPPDSEHRLCCGLSYLLDNGAAEGHVFLAEEELIAGAVELLGAAEELCRRALQVLALEGDAVVRVVADRSVVYQKALYEAEQEVAARIWRLLQDDGGDLKEPGPRIRAYEGREGVRFGAQQRRAVSAALSNRICVITGGPGTGKTTCIRCILSILEEEEGEVLLCAPTGRAAKRMQEASGKPAQTIHRLLEYAGEAGGFTRNEEEPLRARALIVDEASMVDLNLMQALLRAVPQGARLIMVGDADQLPSVGPGNVLADLIQSGVLPVVRLTEIFRQAAQSDIVVGAHAINRGQMPTLNRREGDLFFQRAKSGREAADILRSLVCTRLPAYLKIDPLRDIQLLCPMKKGEVGVWELNRMLQAALNPPSPEKGEVHCGDTLLREGDKVMQMRNNYEMEWSRGDEAGRGVYNGDIGYVQQVDREAGLAWILFDDERLALYIPEDLPDLEPAYCITVHKSQGSEFPVVVLPLMGGPPMLMTRNLLYTAVTRARHMVVLVGRMDCLRAMVDNGFVNRRNADLAGALQRAAGALG